MPTFRKKPEIVDARKFEGGAQNGTDLIFWVNSNEGNALWFGSQKFDPNERRKHEHIRVHTQPYSRIFQVAYVGDWIMRKQDGSFVVIRQQELDEEYDQV